MTTPRTMFEKIWEQHIVAEPPGEPTLLSSVAVTVPSPTSKDLNGLAVKKL